VEAICHLTFSLIAITSGQFELDMRNFIWR
jgi:hypothetical protein